MTPMTNNERREFIASIISKPLPALREMFNKLSQDAKNDHFSDHARGIASEKAKMVKTQITIRTAGGFMG